MGRGWHFHKSFDGVKNAYPLSFKDSFSKRACRYAKVLSDTCGLGKKYFAAESFLWASVRLHQQEEGHRKNPVLANQWILLMAEKVRGREIYFADLPFSTQL